MRDVVGGIAREYLTQEQDRAAFAQAQQTNTLSAYRSYLTQFPNGAYVSQARDRVRQLGGTVPAAASQSASGQSASGQAATAAAGTNLSSQQRVDVQRRLNALGYNTNGTDGSFGPGTRRAIALWQRDRNYAQTGALTTAQANELLGGRSSGSTTPAAGATAGSAAQVEAAIGLTLSQRRAIQAGLTQRGFDTRGVDGAFGAGTRNAIAGWQRANDLTATGYLTAPQVQRLTR